MRELGISIYPEHASDKEIQEYIDLASGYGFTRIFTCLISANGNALIRFEDFIKHANRRNMKVIADITPSVIKDLGIEYTDLKYFKDMGLHGIRLDLGFSGLEESIMTYNDHGLKIEINMSNGTKYLDNILSHQSNRDNLLGCHNFYPHRYTGLSYDHFIKCSEDFKSQNIKTAAFVNSRNARYGPWEVTEGLCTLEEHREKSISYQARDLFYTDLIDDVVIGNMFASKEELENLSYINREKLTFEVELIDSISDIEKKIILEEFHFCRGDMSEYLVRSTQSRVKYKDESFPLKNANDIKKGSIVIESDMYSRYSGELQIALKDMKNSGKSSVVGKIADEDLELLKHIKPWTKFAFKLK